MRGIAYTTVRRLQRFWWRLRGPVTVGARGVVVDDGGRVLLVRHSYAIDTSTSSWYLPGGGVQRRESLVDALRRELREEVGVTLTHPPELLGVYSSFREHKSDHIATFVVRHWTRADVRSQEIADSGMFLPEDLPEGTSPATRRRIAEAFGSETVTFVW